MMRSRKLQISVHQYNINTLQIHAYIQGDNPNVKSTATINTDKAEESTTNSQSTNTSSTQTPNTSTSNQTQTDNESNDSVIQQIDALKQQLNKAQEEHKMQIGKALDRIEEARKKELSRLKQEPKGNSGSSTSKMDGNKIAHGLGVVANNIPTFASGLQDIKKNPCTAISGALGMIGGIAMMAGPEGKFIIIPYIIRY